MNYSDQLIGGRKTNLTDQLCTDVWTENITDLKTVLV